MSWNLHFNDTPLPEGATAGINTLTISGEVAIFDADPTASGLLIHPAAAVGVSFTDEADADTPTIDGLLILTGPDCPRTAITLYADPEAPVVVQVGRQLRGA